MVPCFEKKAGRPEWSYRAHKKDAQTENQQTGRDDATGAESIGQVTGERRDTDIYDKVEIVNWSNSGSADAKGTDHFRQNNTITQSGWVIDKKIDPAYPKDNPCPVQSLTFFQSASPLIRIESI